MKKAKRERGMVMERRAKMFLLLLLLSRYRRVNATPTSLLLGNLKIAFGPQPPATVLFRTLVIALSTSAPTSPVRHLIWSGTSRHMMLFWKRYGIHRSII